MNVWPIYCCMVYIVVVESYGGSENGADGSGRGFCSGCWIVWSLIM